MAKRHRASGLSGAARCLVLLAAGLVSWGPSVGAAPGQDEERKQAADPARSFLEEARALYALPYRDGLESFQLRIKLLSLGEQGLDRIRDQVEIGYEWELPDAEKIAVEGVPGRFMRLVREPLRGLWKDIAGGCVFPDLDGESLAMESAEQGVALRQAAADGSETKVVFDSASKLVLRCERCRGGSQATVVPAFGGGAGSLRLEGKVISVTGEGGDGIEGAFTYAGFVQAGGFELPANLTVNLGEQEVRFSITYIKINGEAVESAEIDPAVLKALIDDFETNYSKSDATRKTDGIKKLMATGHGDAAEAIARKGLKDKDLSLRADAAEALGLMRCRNVVPDLIAAMKPNAQNIKVYSALIQALGRIGDPKAVPSLSTDFWNQKEEATGLHMARLKIEALGKIRSKKSVEALVDLLYVAGPGAMNRLAGPFTAALQGLTGEQLGWDRDAWKDWWKKNGARLKLEED